MERGEQNSERRPYRSRGALHNPLRLERFVEELAKPGVTQAEAAMVAGYADRPECAKVRGSQLMSDPAVRARVEARRRELMMHDAGHVLLLHCPRVGLYRLCFVAGDSVDLGFGRLQEESPVRLQLLWSRRSSRQDLAGMLTPFTQRQHHGEWYEFREQDLRRLVEAAENPHGIGPAAV